MPQDPPKITSKTLRPDFFRALKPGDIATTKPPEQEKTSWINTVASKVGEGAVALGGNIVRAFQGKRAKYASAGLGAAGLSEIQKFAVKSDEEMEKKKAEENERQSLVEAAETLGAAGAAEDASQQDQSGGGKVTDQGKNAEEDVASKQAEERRKQNIFKQRAAAVESKVGEKKKESFMWKILDPIPFFGEISLLRKIPKIFT